VTGSTGRDVTPEVHWPLREPKTRISKIPARRNFSFPLFFREANNEEKFLPLIAWQVSVGSNRERVLRT
jgi:hypothetical protein